MAGNYEAVQAKAIAAKGCSVSVLTIQKKPFYSLRNWNKVNYRMVDGVNVYEGVYPSFPIRSMGRIVKCRTVYDPGESAISRLAFICRWEYDIRKEALSSKARS